MNHTTPTSGAATWETIVDQCTDRLETIQRSLRDEDWDALANVEWIAPGGRLDTPPAHVTERLQRLLDMSQTLQRRLASEMQTVTEELGRGPQLRKASRAYLQGSGTAPDTTTAA